MTWAPMTPFDVAAFAAARFATDRGAFGRFIEQSSLDITTPVNRQAAKATFMSMVPLVAPAVHKVALTALAAAVGPPATNITMTVWPSVRDVAKGVRETMSWAEFGASHEAESTLVVPKEEALAYNPTANRTGYRRNDDTEAMFALVLDADGSGDWFNIWSILEQLGFAALMHRSSSHKATEPRWRLILPLAVPFATPSPQAIGAWRSAYESARTVFGALANLSGPGFDPTTDGPHHAWLPGNRRHANEPPREVVIRDGATLDMSKLLAGLPTQQVVTPVRRNNEAAMSNVPSLMQEAFEKAGLLGRELGDGRRAVRCPWNDFHTKPLGPNDEPTSATVIFHGRVGQFYCSHTCGSKSVEEVLKALPADAVVQAPREIGPMRRAASPALVGLPQLRGLPRLGPRRTEW